MITPVPELLTDAVVLLTEMGDDIERLGTVLTGRVHSLDDVAKLATSGYVAAHALAQVCAGLLEVEYDDVVKMLGLESARWAEGL